MLEALTAVVREAGALAFGRFGGDYRRWDKSPGNPVSEMDLAVDAFLRPRLEAIATDAAWLSEETADDPVRLQARRVWIVDPIDGTRDYLRGRTGWCVSVALVEDGAPVLGVLDAPARGEVWTAAAGQGATCNGERIAVAERSSLPGSRVPADTLPKADRDLCAVSKPNSIALRIAVVARGEADFVATTRVGHEWDIAAAVLLASEAGASVTDARGRAIRFNTPRAEVTGVQACVPGISAAVLKRFGV